MGVILRLRSNKTYSWQIYEVNKEEVINRTVLANDVIVLDIDLFLCNGNAPLTKVIGTI